MKKNYCFVLSLFLFGTMLSSCEKSGNYQEFDRNEIYKHLSSVNVRDAKMIYTKEGTNTRSGESGTFGGVWKILLCQFIHINCSHTLLKYILNGQ